MIDIRPFKQCAGIIDKNDSNEALAQRDYSVECDTSGGPIAIVEGYYIWWCHAHHQPHSHCCQATLTKEIEEMRAGFKKIAKSLSTAMKHVKLKD